MRRKVRLTDSWSISKGAKKGGSLGIFDESMTEILANFWMSS